MDEQNNIKEIVLRIEKKNDEEHLAMRKQFEIQNGSVRSLLLWRARIVGAFAILTVCIIPVAIAAFSG